MTGIASRNIAQTRPQVWLQLVDVDHLDCSSWPLSDRVIKRINLPHDLKRTGVFSLPLWKPAHKPTWGKYTDQVPRLKSEWMGLAVVVTFCPIGRTTEVLSRVTICLLQ